MDEKVKAIISELEAQRNLLGTRCSMLASECASHVEENAKLRSEIEAFKARIANGTLAEVTQ